MVRLSNDSVTAFAQRLHVDRDAVAAEFVEPRAGHRIEIGSAVRERFSPFCQDREEWTHGALSA